MSRTASKTQTTPPTPGAGPTRLSATDEDEQQRPSDEHAGNDLPPEQRVAPIASRFGGREAARFIWTQLTSMRTALVLLFILAVAAVPGSLVPQRNLSPIKVSDFIRQHRVLGPLYDKVGLFGVFTSPWFSAVYLLLFVSLVGCILPRLRVYGRALRKAPPAAPRNLARLPAYARAELPLDFATSEGGKATDQTGRALATPRGATATEGQVDALLASAAARLRRQHYRVVVSGDTVSAERGYLREAGNLLFHLSLLVLLLGVATGVLLGFRGSAVVTVGQGFSNNLTQYDDFSAGAWFKPETLKPFSLTVADFDARFETGPVQRGAARLFRAEVDLIDTPGTPPTRRVLQVNQPLNLDGTGVYLIGHGYAPKVTVRDANGAVAFSGPVVFLPQDGNFTSLGVIKAPDARPRRLAFQAVFVPTSRPSLGPRSQFPDAAEPALYLNAFTAPPAVETGVPESVYSLNTAGMTQLRNPDGSPVAVRLTPGEFFTLPDRQGSISFDGWTRWVKLQVGDSPGAPIVFGSVAAAVAGLCLSLFVRPRRLWVRVGRRDGRASWVEVAGLDRADARTGLEEAVDDLTALLTPPAAPSALRPADSPDTPAAAQPAIFQPAISQPAVSQPSIPQPTKDPS